MVVLALAVFLLLAPAGPARAALGLKFYFPVSVSGPLAKVMDGMVADFNRLQPGIHVEPVFAGGYFETMAKTQTAVQGGTPPDVAVLLSTDLFTLLDMGAIIPLDGFIEESGGDRFRQDFFEAFWLNARIGRTIYSIPFQRSTIVLYYNKDAFAKAGLDPNAPPRTWAELREVAQKLTVRDASGAVTRWGVGIPTTGFTYWLFQGFVAEAGGTLANLEGTEVYYNTPQTRRALGFWLALQDAGVQPPNVTEWGTLPTEFIAGKFAMVYHSTGSLTFVHTNASFPFGTAFMPAEARYGTPTGGGNLYIFKRIHAARQRAAWQFVQWMTAPQQAARWSEASGYVAVRRSAFNIKLYQEYAARFPQAATARDQLAYAQAELSTHNSGQVQKVLSDNLQAALTRTRTPAQALAAAQAQADQILRRFRKK
ncbi:MAG: ABC transporter substrate-binding protein [Bacillati bacterium ANGP1]|uniref:ABC transporter substrate-binding protein n=1 Tax=Candidatus Segetimicrobium genomatis TaxID=2569760 RepID=A0A537JN43_9BACT|nr:MAG: ABC transporter substrate-binding protein [Terrabacteria group bacterium ANGP1]